MYIKLIVTTKNLLGVSCWMTGSLEYDWTELTGWMGDNSEADGGVGRDTWGCNKHIHNKVTEYIVYIHTVYMYHKEGTLASFFICQCYCIELSEIWHNSQQYYSLQAANKHRIRDH